MYLDKIKNVHVLVYIFNKNIRQIGIKKPNTGNNTSNFFHKFVSKYFRGAFMKRMAYPEYIPLTNGSSIGTVLVRIRVSGTDSLEEL